MTNQRIAVAMAALLVGSLLGMGVVVGPVTAEETRNATLEIEQPHYIDEPVQETRADGKVIYKASGEELRLYPQAFDRENVVEYGITPTEGAVFSPAEMGDGYTLQATETGTYELYWVVERDVTEDNQTATERVRYEAAVEVTGALDVTPVSESRFEEYRHDAEQYQDLNSSVQSMIDNSWIVSVTIGDRPTADEWIESALNKQRAVHNPTEAFGPGVMLLVFGIFSLGGAAIATIFLGWHVKAISWLKGRLNIFEAVEKEEGDLIRKFEAQQRRKSQQSLQNKRFSDVYLPHTADGMRSLGETPFEADNNLTANSMLPSVGAAYKAQAMGLDDYVGVVPEPDETATDGGEPDGDMETQDVVDMLRARDEDVEIIPESDAPDDAVVLDLTDAERDWYDILPVNSRSMVEYSVVDTDIDRSEISVGAKDWTPEEILAEAQLEQQHFESAAVAVQHLRDFQQDVREHPLTDTDGEPRTCRAVFETYLRDSQLLDDQYNIPKQHVIDLFEAAIEADDPVEDGLEHAQDVEEGKYA